MQEAGHIYSAYSESVEKLVDMYIGEWNYKPEKMENEILSNWEMDEESKQTAISYLKDKYKV